MKSVGEAMAHGPVLRRGAAEGDALAGADAGGVLDGGRTRTGTAEDALDAARTPHDGRLHAVERALRLGATAEQVHEATGIDPWFVDQLLQVVELRAALEAPARSSTRRCCAGPSGTGCQRPADRARAPGWPARRTSATLRGRLGVRPVYKTVDTCAAEFAAQTPYHYSSYDEETEVAPSGRDKVLILGSGPNRIGQGIEFDYSCVHASFALPDAGFETVMVNCNPETVTTDYDTTDRLYFEPLTVEDVLEVVARRAGVRAGRWRPAGRGRLQLGGQTPLRLAQELKDCRRAGARHLARRRSTSPRTAARSAGCWPTPGCRRPKHGTATVVRRGPRDRRRDRLPGAGAPVVRARRARHGDRLQRRHARRLRLAGRPLIGPDHPVLVDRFLEDAVEIDVDALYDGTDLYLGGVMEHIEEAGIHSGDSACALPPITLGRADLLRIRASTEAIAARRRRARAAERAVRAQGRRALRAGGQPAGQPHRAVRLQGDRGAAGQGRGPDHARGDRSPSCAPRGCCRPTGDGADAAARRADRGQGGGAAVRPVPHRRRPRRRHRARPGDEVHRRGDGHRRGLRHGVRQVARPRPTASLPTKGTVFVSRGQPGQAVDDLPGEAAGRPGLRRCWPRSAPPRCCAATGCRPRWSASTATGRRRRRAAASSPATSTWSSTPRSGVGQPARLDGYEIRTAAVARRHPVHHHRPGRRGRVQGIEALRRGDIGVRVLQEHHRGTARVRREATPRDRASSEQLSAASRCSGRGRWRSARSGALPPSTDGGRAGHRRADPARGSSSPSRSAAGVRRCCCAGRSRSTACGRPGCTAAPSSSSSRVHGPGTTWLAEPRPGRTGSTSSARSARPSRCRARRSPRCWSAAATAARPLLPLATALRARGLRGATMVAGRGRRRPAVRRAGGPRGWPRSFAVTTDDGIGGRSAAGSPTCCRR